MAAPNHHHRYHYEVDEPTYWPTWREKYNPAVLYQLFLYFSVCVVLLETVPNSVWDPEVRSITFLIGFLGIWRYGWWFTHAIRASIYGRLVYPRLKLRGEEAWKSGWRPRHLHFMMTTYKEHRDITEKVIRSIINEVKDSEVSGTIWLGSGDRSDEILIENLIATEATDLDLTLRIIRQNQPGKRLAIGLVLRSMSRNGVQPDDLVVFMDGDFILAPGAVRNCLPLFKVYPDLQAATTDEEVLCIGPAWVRVWLTMRFAQRRLAMQSHSLAGRVLTLTGRMSVFRAEHLLNLEFIRLLEADHLEHWLWGKFRFLSGDDKSTWYYMLKNRARMLYVPDALGYTVEVIEGSGMDRMVQNFRRWSGNMLRNGSRAIQLGPRRVPFFIWWCLVDQRLSMWTMLFSPVLAISASFLNSPTYIAGYCIFIAVTRMLLSLFLYTYSRKVHIAYPFILYFNQLINAAVKVYCLFRLSKQRWANRGNQTIAANGSRALQAFQSVMAMYLTAFWVVILFLTVTIYSALIELPSTTFMRVFFLT